MIRRRRKQLLAAGWGCVLIDGKGWHTRMDAVRAASVRTDNPVASIELHLEQAHIAVRRIGCG